MRETLAVKAHDADSPCIRRGPDDDSGADRASHESPSHGHFFFLNDPAPPEISPLPLHDPLPILRGLPYRALDLSPRQRSVGALVLPFILLFFVAAHLAPADKLSPPDAHGPTFAFHVALNILAYAAFTLSCVLSLTFLIEERFLRNHRMGEIGRASCRERV